MIARNYKPIVYFEGVKMPINQVSLTFRANGKSVIQISMPGDPELWPKLDIQDLDGSEQTDNGMDIVASSNLQGIQPRTLIHVFVADEATGEEVFVTEGRIVQTGISYDKAGTAIQVVAFGSVYFMEETGMYMVETARSLGVNSDDSWNGRRGTSTTSNIASKLKDEGLDNGIRNLLEDAGLNTSQASNLTWRLLRLSQRLSIVNNPSALGNFNETRLSTILDKAIGQVSSRQPIAQVVMQLLRLLRYFILNVPAPSFTNAIYSGEGIVDQTAQDEEDPEVTSDVEYTALLTDLDITNPTELQMNDMVVIPQMVTAPPPRCNVFFPIDYKSLTVTYGWEKRPTRGISRLGGRSALRGDESDSVRLPESFAEGTNEHGRYFTSAEEKYRGTILSTFNHDRPEFIDDMGSDYIRGYMSQSFFNQQYNGAIRFTQPSPLNLKPIPGLPALILLRNGQHLLAHLDQVVHILSVQNGCFTMPQFSMPRHYEEIPPESATAFWFESDHFLQKNIGVYVYKSIIGKYFTAKDELSTEPDVGDDLSILKHLYRNTSPGPDSDDEIILVEETEANSVYSMTTDKAVELGLVTEEDAADVDGSSLIEITLVDNPEQDLPSREYFESQNPIVSDGARLMTEEEVEAAKEADTAIKDAIDLLWAEYKGHDFPEIYSFNYGRRIPITRKHLFEDFYNAVVSTDLNMITGGYELATNGLSLTAADRESLGLELGGVIENESSMGDTKPMGCFIRERQECYTKPAARLYFGANIARDSSELIDIIREIDETAEEEQEIYAGISETILDTAINTGLMNPLVDEDGNMIMTYP